MAQNYNHMDVESKIKYIIYKIDIYNREQKILKEHYFAVIQKIWFPSPISPLNITNRLSYGNEYVINYFIVNSDGKLEILDEIDDRIKIKSISDIDLWLSETRETAIHIIKSKYENHMSNIPYEAKLYMVEEQSWF
jgi:hypothetical protein